MTLPTKKHKPKTQSFLKSKLEDFPNSYRFDQFSCSSSWRVMARNVPAGAGVKGLLSQSNRFLSGVQTWLRDRFCEPNWHGITDPTALLHVVFKNPIAGYDVHPSQDQVALLHLMQSWIITLFDNIWRTVQLLRFRRIVTLWQLWLYRNLLLFVLFAPSLPRLVTCQPRSKHWKKRGSW